ncbi:MAG: hypothetical protein KQ78_00078 [Candidatus Izimaplasma bacterium HR2]|nr:MAG: hypothetical protein KQ78_00078 [Candidatus Izimaplasma bacterium HR2]
MAKMFKSNLPKVISKANRDISTIIESDIASEAALLKELVNQVREANLEVKKNNNQRITETKRKLAELDEEISNLNSSIDLVDRETVIQQLNEMIDAENKIFRARQEVRFFDNNKTPERIVNLEGIYQELVSSIDKLNTYEETFRDEIIDGNKLLFDKQLVVTTEIINLMDNLFDSKREHVTSELASLKYIYDSVKGLEEKFNNHIRTSVETCYALNEASGSIFKEIDDDVNIGEKIQLDFENKMIQFSGNIETLETKFESKKEEINESYLKYEQGVNAKQEIKNQKVLDEERKAKEAIDDKLKDIRLQIINAEKKNNLAKVAKLMKEFEKVEKSTSSLKMTSQLSKELSTITKKTHTKSINHLLTVEKKHVTDMNKQNHSLSLEKIKFEEAKILYKIKSDYNALLGDVDINKNRVDTLNNYLDTKVSTGTKIYKLKQDIKSKELIIMKENELDELLLIDTFKEFLIDLKKMENTRIVALKQNLNNYRIIKLEQEYQVKKSIEDVKLDQALNDIEKLILSRRNETLIKNEKIKEEANSEIIYQESLINIAKKEHELQLIKVESLYENERNLAEEQIERINLGVKVNDAFVKTTLENQLLFATQQIKCAQSEYEIRIESISLTLNQELDYANKKIDYYRQKYEYEKSKIRKELDDKLEDLNYKLLLFTDEKDNRKIIGKIEKLKATFNKMIEDIEDVENQDVEILRYDKVIKDANSRAEIATVEAGALKEQTVDSFETLYFQTKEKFDLIEETDQTEETRGIMPVLNNTALSSANERLQRATREADELYKEKIIDPLKVIEETKVLLENMTNSKESDIFIEQQKEFKHSKIKEHKEASDKLLKIKQDSLLPIKEEIPVMREKLIKELEVMSSNLFTNSNHRGESEIQKDYLNLDSKEIVIHKVLIENLVKYKLEFSKELEKILKDTNQMIKVTAKPYKKYIRYASKGLTAKKKVLAREFLKKLKKAQNELDSKYKKLLNEL